MSRPSVTDIFTKKNQSFLTYKIDSIVFKMIQLPSSSEFQSLPPFALAEYPVTQALWKAVYELAIDKGIEYDTTLFRPNPSFFSGAQRPIENISWDETQEFCRTLNILFEKKSKCFRLPSEDEWLYAAWSGKRKELFDESERLTEIGWYRENNGMETMPVGLLSPDVFGLYDLGGNIWEWCEDDWDKNYASNLSDGPGWSNNLKKRNSYRVRRGGSWINQVKYSRDDYRGWGGLEGLNPLNGFRLASSV